MLDLLVMLGASFSVVLLFWTFLWGVYVFRGNAGIADIGWPISFILIVWIYQFLGWGDFAKSLVLTVMVTLWALRLMRDLVARFDWDKEDPRYVRIRQNWGGDRTYLLFLVLFIFQGFLTLVLSIPFLVVAQWGTPVWSAWEGVGILLWGIGIGGEALADYQLQRFKREHPDSREVCEQGLWAFSRHPNYFFEWIVWIGFAVYVWPNPWGVFGLIGPAIMYILLVRISGIPLAEAQSLTTKGDAYVAYQHRVNAFMPWFRKH